MKTLPTFTRRARWAVPTGAVALVAAVIGGSLWWAGGAAPPPPPPPPPPPTPPPPPPPPPPAPPTPAPPPPTPPAAPATPAAAAAKPAAAPKPPAAAPKPAAAPAAATPLIPPIPGYDDLSIASLRARLRVLDADAVHGLLEYEKAHEHRDDVITMFERRLAKIEEKAG